MKVLKKVVISYADNYGGGKAWLVQKFFNGVVDGSPYSHLVFKREHFNDIAEFIEKCINDGFIIEIKNYDSNN